MIRNRVKSPADSAGRFTRDGILMARVYVAGPTLRRDHPGSAFRPAGTSAPSRSGLCTAFPAASAVSCACAVPGACTVFQVRAAFPVPAQSPVGTQCSSAHTVAASQCSSAHSVAAPIVAARTLFQRPQCCSAHSVAASQCSSAHSVPARILFQRPQCCSAHSVPARTVFQRAHCCGITVFQRAQCSNARRSSVHSVSSVLAPSSPPIPAVSHAGAGRLASGS